MAISTLCAPEAPPKVRRTRKTHNKVRTGCLTCKIRRKKCDETKPACLRCTSTGRRCDGYNHNVLTENNNEDIPGVSPSKPIQSSTARESTPPHPARYDEIGGIFQENNRSLLTFCHTPSAVMFSSDVDFHCFDFFRFNTGPSLEAYFSSSVWRSTALQTALTHPVVLKAATAVGAVHRRFNYGISREAFEYCAIADRLYREATKAFLRFRSECQLEAAYSEVSVVVSMLFAAFEGFQGNYREVIQNTSFGLSCMWDRPYLTIRSESQFHKHDTAKPVTLPELVDKLRVGATKIFGSPPLILNRSCAFPTRIPAYFTSLEEARDSIFIEVEWILQTPAHTWRDEQNREKAQTIHVSRLWNWTVAFVEMIRLQGGPTKIQRQASILLVALREVAYLILYATFVVDLDVPIKRLITGATDTNGSSDHTCLTTADILSNDSRLYSHLYKQITRLSLLISTKLELSSPWYYMKQSYDADSGVLASPLTSLMALKDITATPETSKKTKWKVRQLSKFTPVIKQSESAEPEPQSIYRLAERLASLEEHALLASIGNIVPKHKDIIWLDAACFLEERKVLLQYCHTEPWDVQNSGLNWVQEWLQF